MVVDGNSGFTKKSFEAIANQTKNRPLYCNLVFGEMCIRRYVEMDGQQNTRIFNMGAEYSHENDDIPLDKSALLQLVVEINKYWKMPITYFLIDGLNGGERDNLLTKAIDRSAIRSFRGLVQNLYMINYSQLNK